MKKKALNPVLVFILGLATFGISNHIFIYMISKHIGKDSNGELIFPMREAVLNIITLGIYGIIWTYRMTRLVNMEKGTSIICTLVSAFPIRCISLTMITGQL